MDEEDEDYIYFGTPLPDLIDEIDHRKKVAKEQEVRDEKGRQRFHGAFTGGFSAGYFNTVGTKEGWAPSTFISSRSKAAECMQQNPEDFMDEEDFGEFGIATRRIHTTSQFQDISDSKTGKRPFHEVDNVIPGEAPLKNIVKPVKESIGIEILKKLGWKLGQGIGPRVKKATGAEKVYGCSPFPVDMLLEEDDPLADSFTFAPKDAEAEFYAPKDNVFGLGYTGLSKVSVLAAHVDTFNPTYTKSWLKKDKRKLTITGQAFGVGAFEDEDADIYGKDDMSQYDFSELEGKTSKSDSKKPINSSGSVLEGFCLASHPPSDKKTYPPPELPRNFKPIRSAMPKVAVNLELQFTPRHNLSAGDRSLLLGEKKFQSFQISSEKKKIENKPNFSMKTESPALPNKTPTFRPFPNDQLKQKRYEEYLRLKNLEETDQLVQPSSMTEWEKQQEKEEFARAALLFKPLSAALSSKFESKSHLSVEHEVMEALARTKKEAVSVSSVDKKTLVGLSNRRMSEWHPASLLCKRFNVPNPYPNSTEASGSQKTPKFLFDHISFEDRDITPIKNSSNVPNVKLSEEKGTYTPQNTLPLQSTESSSTITLQGSSAVDSGSNQTGQETVSKNSRPPIDFFKDIFENSSSDEEDPSDTKLQTPSTVLEPSEIDNVRQEKQSSNQSTTTPLQSVKETKKVGFGVFANLDLDALNQRLPPKKPINNNSAVIQSNEKKESLILKVEADSSTDATSVLISKSDLTDLYGPELPPNYSETPEIRTPKEKVKKSLKHKRKHKHKHHKHKSKKKRHNSKQSDDDDDSFASDEDIPPIVIIEKFKKLQQKMKK